MIVIRHQCVGMNSHAKPLTHLPKQVQEVSVIGPIEVDPLPVMPAGRDVIPAARNIDS